jgi:hypothetical protein
MVPGMLVRIFKSLLIGSVVFLMGTGCQPKQPEYRDSKGNKLPATQPQHTPPPREPLN